MNESLDAVLQRPWVWRGRRLSGRGEPLLTGHAGLDARLPEGWPVGAVTEVLVSATGCGEVALLMPALVALASRRQRILWIGPPHLPYPPALFQHGLEEVLVVRPQRPEDTSWAAEQALRSGACAAVLCWPGQLDDRRFRRMQLAAEAGRSWGVVFRARDEAGPRSPAALRISVAARDEHQQVRILKRRGPAVVDPIDLPRLSGRPPG